MDDPAKGLEPTLFLVRRPDGKSVRVSVCRGYSSPAADAESEEWVKLSRQEAKQLVASLVAELESSRRDCPVHREKPVRPTDTKPVPIKPYILHILEEEKGPLRVDEIVSEIRHTEYPACGVSRKVMRDRVRKCLTRKRGTCFTRVSEEMGYALVGK